MMSPEPAPADQRYATLCERAVQYIQGRGGAASEDLLIAHVFGNTGSLALWRPLLRSVMAEDQRVVFRGDGLWSIATAAGETGTLPILDEFVAIDVETTGLRPSKQRVIEIALYRFRAGQLVERLETLINPGRAIPAYISNLTTITNTHVEDAPAFAEEAEGIVAFIGSSLLVGHNVSFDISFVNEELKRADRAPLINERLDTMGLAVRLLKNVRKPSLDRVAVAVGLSPRKIHRAGRDAQLTGEVALRLSEEAVRQGVRTLDELRGIATVVRVRPRDGVGRGRAVMDRAWLADVPKKPGVYLMRDQHGNVIYVGKAKNLRDRVSSYYSQPLGYTRKMDGLLESMVRIDTEVVGTELQALILEAQLIRRYQPRYNTAMRSFEHYPYIRVDIGNPWPRITLAKVRKDDGARYFGPYRSAASARRTVEVINNAVPLRTCTRSFKTPASYGKPCIRLDLGKCLGPCVGQTVRDEYRRMIDDVLDFLDGKDQGLKERLWAELEKAAERLDFERASRLRRDLRTSLALIAEQSRLRTAELDHNLLLVQPSADPGFREVMVVLRGRIWAQLQAGTRQGAGNREPGADVVLDVSHGVRPQADAGTRESPAADLARRLGRTLERFAGERLEPVDHNLIDETNILNRWLYRQAGHPAILPLDLDRRHDLDHLMTLADTVLRLDDSLIAADYLHEVDDAIMDDGTASALLTAPAGA
ncbi:MAG: Excinuclease ABC subunit C [uncultured Thermomicrobiales bacterium]|uniref:Excinuclease ABC subunit C n=1 Tax=uncultured Thermomicrobiales bacterium TaxID=1645740 RepID=A0A6J4VJN1_9BACT|nr:MAG: Excinuclease ABC subunit C [uncultured Thermomicrobiales bacterium]